MSSWLGAARRRSQRRGSFTLHNRFAVYDMLLKSNLTKAEIKKIKSVAVSLLKALGRQMREVQDIFSKVSTRDGFKQSIYDFLYDDRTGLPVEKYDEAELSAKTDVLFSFFERQQQELRTQSGGYDAH